MQRLLIVVLLCCTLIPAQSAQAATPQLRAFWVDAFHDGFKTPAQTTTLVDEAQRAGANALFVQVRRRADSYYRNTLEPLAAASNGQPDMASGYDPLADLITKAHARNIQVHAWTVALPAWRSNYTQPDRSHVWYQHGPNSSDNWFMLDQAGRIGDCADNCSLDPGHPAAADYIVRVLMHLVKNYDIDGLHLDYIRYPSPQFGYTRESVRRFREATGRTDWPSPTDAQWMQWRRDQVTKLVKRIYVETHALKPRIAVSAATITWGPAPTGDFSTSTAYHETLQDWAGWLQEGYIDFALLMNYYDESNATYAARFTNWNNFARANKGRREVAIGLGAWLNTTDNTFAQLDRSTSGTMGISLYSYALPTSGDRAQFIRRIGTERWSNGAPAPTLPWLASPTAGHLMGYALFGGVPADGIQVRATDQNGVVRFTTTDANGVFSWIDLSPGVYTVSMRDSTTGQTRTAQAEVRAGAVTSLTLLSAAPRERIYIPIARR